MVLQTENAQKKSPWKYTNEIIPSIFPVVIHRRNYFVGECGICREYFATLSKISMEYVRRYKHR